MIGTPFQHQARMPGVGLDCAGLVIAVARRLGLVPANFDITGYQRTPDGLSLERNCDAHLVRIAAADLDGGDVVLIAWGDGDPHHVGIVADYLHGGLSMVHAEGRRHKRVIETRLLFGRSMRLVAAYRLPYAERTA